MKIYDQKNKCYGCTTCLNSCPVGAIKMIEDEKGFLYPEVDEEKCISCGLCKKVCPYNKEISDNNVLNAYAAKNKDDYIRSLSSSGGLFSVMANYVLDNNGIVVGVILDNNLDVKHVCIDNKEDLVKMRGSKYVQSNMIGIFPQIKKHLENQKMVLFTGTPCQCAGLRNYLKKDYNNLFICDLVCHGVPSPKLFKEHIDLLNKKGKVINYKFRSKVNGWHNHTEVICYENKEDYKSNISQSFKQFFGSNLNLRDSCYNCKFANIKRIGDITIGDFWGAEKKCKNFDDNKGISLVLINNKHGMHLFKTIKDELILLDVTNIDYRQKPLLCHVNKSKKVDEFWDDYFKYGYVYILKNYTRSIMMMKIRKILKKIIFK